MLRFGCVTSFDEDSMFAHTAFRRALFGFIAALVVHVITGGSATCSRDGGAHENKLVSQTMRARVTIFINAYHALR